MKAMINATIVMKDYLIPDGVILIDDGIIKKFGKSRSVSIPKNTEIIDAEGHYVGPGLIDIHTHAQDNEWIFENPKHTSSHMFLHGVTGVLPALYNNLNKDAYLKAVEDILSSNENGDFDNFLGFYMEGPYLSPNFGCERDKPI